MKKKNLFILLGVGVILVGIIITVLIVGNFKSVNDDKSSKEDAVPQLDSDKREDADTMVLLNSPPVMPSDHEMFWNNMDYKDCLTCHGDSNTGVVQPSAIHYKNGDVSKGEFKDTQCIQCHATQAYTSKEKKK